MIDITKPIDLETLVLRGLTSEEKAHYFLTRNQVRRTKAIFHEYVGNGSSEELDVDVSSLYTTYDCNPLHYKKIKNGTVRYDLKQLYMAVGDPTEELFIKKFLYDLKQWERICANKLFAPMIEEWRKELRLKIKSQMFDVLVSDALDPDSKTKTSSAKYILDRFYDPKTGSKIKKKVTDQDNKEAAESSFVLEDIKRMKEFRKVN